MKTVLRYLWWIALCIAQLAIIGYVFDHLKGRTETIIVAILGLLYVTVRSVTIIQGITFAHFAISADKEFTRLRELLGEDPMLVQSHRKEVALVEDRIITGKLIITGIFLSLVSLFCLVVLFSSVER